MNHMHEPFVKHETSGRIATLTFNRPDVRNAISTLQDCADLVNAVEAAERDDSVSCIILTGCGGAFCAGGNIRAMQERSGIGPTDSPAGTRSNYRRGVQSVIVALWKTELPMIAAINGHAIGLGLDIACLCDAHLRRHRQVRFELHSPGHRAGRRRRVDIAACDRQRARSGAHADRRYL
jgi:2-(1,2-epoxy-1,2-dihydrophenyl)acetyl-CoA isomerase